MNQRERVEHRRLIVMTIELDPEAQERVKNQVQAEQAAGALVWVMQLEENSKDREIADGLVDLGGMQWDVEGYVGELFDVRVGEAHRPGAIAQHAVATAGGKTANATNGMAKCDARRKAIHGLEDGQIVLAHVIPGEAQRENEAALVDASRAQRGEREHLARILRVVLPVENKHHQLGAHQASNGAIDHQILNRLGWQSRPARQLVGGPEASQKRQRHHDAIGGQEESVDVNEFREHALSRVASCW